MAAGVVAHELVHWVQALEGGAAWTELEICSGPRQWAQGAGADATAGSGDGFWWGEGYAKLVQWVVVVEVLVGGLAARERRPPPWEG